MGLKHNSAILTFGIVAFDPYSDFIGDRLHVAIDLDDSVRRGLSIDANTILWWLDQSTAARNALQAMQAGAVTLPTALDRLYSFLRLLGAKNEVRLWSCGSRDIEWMESAHAACERPVPWGYRTADFRTIRDEFALPEDAPPATVSHDALADAVWQAQMLQNIYRRLGKHE